MKRNTYVTATLFVVFGLLTVAYWRLDVANRNYEPNPDDYVSSEIRSLEDVAAIGELPKDCEECEEAKDEDVMAENNEENTETSTDEDASALAEASDADAPETDEDGANREVISRLDAQRDAINVGRTQQVSALTDIIANPDASAEIKSDAKDALNELQSFANSSLMLETVLRHMGFDDVVVNAGADAVRVTVQVATIDDVPTREELAEIYTQAGIEFGAHRNGRITVEFQPLN